MNKKFMEHAVSLALNGLKSTGHGPFGAVIVKNNDIIGTGINNVTLLNDPTAHAEVSAIRDACHNLNDFSLKGCEIYTTCEPCPMCLGAIMWSRIDRIYFGATREDAARIDFDDRKFYDEIAKPPHLREIPMTSLARENCLEIFRAWTQLNDKKHY